MENKAKEIYLFRVKRNLHCSAESKKKLMKYMESYVEYGVKGNDDLTVKDYAKSVGTPQEMARSLEDSLDEQERNKYLKRAMDIKRAVVIALAVALLLFALWLLAMFIDGHMSNYNSYFEETIEVITEEYNVDEVDLE